MRALAIPASPSGTVPLTRAEYDQLIDSGLLEDQPIELLSGRKVAVVAEPAEHAALVEEVAEQLEPAARAAGLQVRRGHPVALSDVDEPEPDVAVVTRRADNYRSGHPTAADVHLLVEVARVSLVRDLGEKAERYAAAGVGEYWVVDLRARRTTRHTDPDPAGGPRGGRYLSVRTVPFGTPLRPEALDADIVVE